MLNSINEYFELVEDDDLENGRQWIFECPECGALFSSKAIPGRTIFPWFGYHPNDGDCQVITRSKAFDIYAKADSCTCSSSIQRVVKSRRLLELVLKTKGEKHVFFKSG